MVDLTQTIQAKSNQLNADDLVGHDLIIKITKVEASVGAEQPVTIHYEGDNGRPYKPCLTMRRVFLECWGGNGSDYVGRSALLYRDPDVKWAGQPVGGIRIRALSHINKPAKLKLAVTRGKKKDYIVEVLATEQPAPAQPKHYPDANFNNLKTRIQGYIESGEKTAQDIINQLSARAALTDAQIEFINSFKFNEISDMPDDDPLDDFDAPPAAAPETDQGTPAPMQPDEHHDEVF